MTQVIRVQQRMRATQQLWRAEEGERGREQLVNTKSRIVPAAERDGHILPLLMRRPGARLATLNRVALDQIFVRRNANVHVGVLFDETM